MPSKNLNRRSFIHQSAAALSLSLAASSYARVLGSNDRLSIGIIGCGSRGSALLKECLNFCEAANAEVTAVCDIWRQHREAAAATVESSQERKPRLFTRYDELLALADLDATIIATCDHHHPIMLRDAAKAKKDVYVEKPLALVLDHLNEAYDAVQANNIIVQNGTQLRSLPSFTACRDFVQSGKLGQIVKFEQGRNEYRPYWYQYIREIQPEDTDWKAFLMHTDDQPWNPRVYTGWMGFRPFSNGALGGYMSHFTDLVHYISGIYTPKSVVANGGKYLLEDDFTVPDTVSAVFEYPGFAVSYHTDMGNGGASYTRAVGTKGVLDMTDWNNPVIDGGGSQDEDKVKETIHLEPIERDAHMLDWLKCIRDRKQPNADIDAGYAQGITAIMSDMALLSGKRMVFDPQKRTIQAG